MRVAPTQTVRSTVTLLLALWLTLCMYFVGSVAHAAPAKKSAEPQVLTTTAAQPSPQALKAIAAEAASCYGKCHDPIKAFRLEGKHQKVGCKECHGKLDLHLADEKVRPTTNTDPAVCGGCHKNQFDTLFAMNWNKTARKEKGLATGPAHRSTRPGRPTPSAPGWTSRPPKKYSARLP